MLFNSIHFLIFGPLVLLVYFQIPNRYRNAWLFLTSLYFYAIFKIIYLALLVYCFLTTKFFVDKMFGAKTPKTKILFLNLAVWNNLILLFSFKYVDFLIKAINALLQIPDCSPEALQPIGILLPMGISFFTLQAVSYAVDVYRGTVLPARTYFQFGLFLSFFPQLVAGPIIRAGDLLHQFLEPTTFKKENLVLGLRQILAGFFKKTFVADPIAIFLDPIYSQPDSYSTWAMWVAAVFFSIQVYCDFAGYSDVAIGLGRIFGFEIPKNFHRPFLANTITELWRRWHISFSSWLRDYVYISLGGSRVSLPRVYLNLFLTTFVSGIWHGADWTYVLWGATHAGVMVIEKFLFQFERIKLFWDKIPRYFQFLYPVGIFVIAAIIFRSRDTETRSGIENAFYMLGKMFHPEEGMNPRIPEEVWVAVLMLFGSEAWQEFREKEWNQIWQNPWLVITLSLTMYLVCFLIYSATVSQQFIYFQF